MTRLGLVAETRVVAARPEPQERRSPGAPAPAGLADALPGAPPARLGGAAATRDGPPPAEQFPGLLASDLEHGSLYELLNERYDTEIATARETLEPVPAQDPRGAAPRSEPRSPRIASRGHRIHCVGSAGRVQSDFRTR